MPPSPWRRSWLSCSTAKARNNEKSIIMAAFLNDNKHPDLLLKAWKNLKADFPDWHVTIMGNGEVERFQRYGSNYGFG